LRPLSITKVVFYRCKISVKSKLRKKVENQEKSGENVQNQLLISGEFLPGDRFENQEVWQPGLGSFDAELFSLSENIRRFWR